MIIGRIDSGLGLLLILLAALPTAWAENPAVTDLAHRYAMCSAWWNFEYEFTHGRLRNDLPKTLQSRRAHDIAVNLTDETTVRKWIEAHLNALRRVTGGILAAVYYQESRVDTYLCRKMVQQPERFIGDN